MGYSFEYRGGDFTSLYESLNMVVSGYRTTDTEYKYVHFYTNFNSGELEWKAVAEFNSSGRARATLLCDFYFGKTYTINLYAYHSNYDTKPSKLPSVTQDTITLTVWPRYEDITMELIQYNATTIQVKITAEETRGYDRYYLITQNGVIIGTITISANTTSSSYYATGLTAGSYMFEASYVGGGYQSSTGTASATSTIYSADDTGYYSYTAGTNNVHLYLSNITNRDYDRTVYYYWENTKTGGNGTKNQVLAAGETKNDRDMSGLTVASGYKFRIYVTNPAGYTTYDTGYFKVRTKNNFSWSTDVSSGKEFNLKASDWNKYTSQLSSKASYYGITYNPAEVSTGDKLTAEKFNNIVATINKLVDGNKDGCVTKMSSVSAGDSVTAACLQLLAKCLNE